MSDVLTYFSYLNDDILGTLLLYLSPDLEIPEIIRENLSPEFSWSLLILKRYPYYPYTIKRSYKISSILGVNTDYDTSLNEDTYKILLYIESKSTEFADIIQYSRVHPDGTNITSLLNDIATDRYNPGSKFEFDFNKLKNIVIDIFTYGLSLGYSYFQPTLTGIKNDKDYKKIKI